MKQASRRQYHYIYKITRLDESGKYYIGMHSTDNLDDGYFGSGKHLWRSINKHGKDKHQKEILEFLPSREALKLREKEIVNAELLEDKKCMNIAIGGGGGSTSKQMQALWADPEYRKRVSDKVSLASKKMWKDPEYKEKHRIASSEALKKLWQDPEYRERCVASNPKSFLGKSHSEETKKSISEKNSINMLGAKNSVYGKRWISNMETKISKMVSKDTKVEYPWVYGNKVWITIEKQIENQNKKLLKAKITEEKENKTRLVEAVSYANAYIEDGDLNIVADKFDVSIVTVRKKIRFFEKIHSTNIIETYRKIKRHVNKKYYIQK
jgi:hypothetical protein